MNNIIGCCKDNLNVRVYTVVVLVCFKFYSCKLYMCHIFIGQKSGGMVTKTTFRPWNPICLMNHAGWHEVDPALTSWKLQKKAGKNASHCMVLLLISALASMVNVMESYAAKELAFLDSETKTNTTTDCIFLHLRKGGRHSSG